MADIKHAKWPGWTAIVYVDGDKWAANVFHPKGDQILSYLIQGRGEDELTAKLQWNYGAPEHIEWKPGNGE